jgi:hypothetical protein
MDSKGVLGGASRSPWIYDIFETQTFFYHLHVGSELSSKGSPCGVRSDRAAAMASALKHATPFRLQYEENDFKCSQMAIGRYYKIFQCTEMALDYAN